jgi:hypothetical protein
MQETSPGSLVDGRLGDGEALGEAIFVVDIFKPILAIIVSTKRAL